jgi:hypothetical protein
MKSTTNRIFRTFAPPQSVGLLIVMLGLQVATVAGGEPSVRASKAASPQRGSPNAKTMRRVKDSARPPLPDPCKQMDEIQSDIEFMRQEMERQVNAFSHGPLHGADHFGSPAIPMQGESSFHIPSFGAPADGEVPGRFHESPKGLRSFRSAWHQQSASAWSQRGSRFSYEQAVRGVVVRLEGQIVRNSLALERIEIGAGEGDQRTAYATSGEIPAELRDEVETARQAAMRYLE